MPSTVKAPELMVKPAPVMSVIAESVPTLRLSVTVVVALSIVALPSVIIVWPFKLAVVLTVKVSMLVVVALSEPATLRFPSKVEEAVMNSPRVVLGVKADSAKVVSQSAWA